MLKGYGPVFLHFFGDLDSKIALRFLKEFPTQNAIMALTPRRLVSWLKRQGYSAPYRVEEMKAKLTGPVLPVANHLQEAKAPQLRYLAVSLLRLKEEIGERNRQITQRFEALPESELYASLPGAGPTLGPALLACLGRDAERFTDLDEARAWLGTAPVTRQSGRTRLVSFRWGCWKFARRTLQLFAEQSLHTCAWARALYIKQRQSGHAYHEAVRAVAHKWVKILLAMKRTGTCYQEEKFTHSQRRYLLKSLQSGPAMAAI